MAKDIYVNTLIGDRNPMILFETNWKALSASQQVMFPYDTSKSEHFRGGEIETDEERADCYAESLGATVPQEYIDALGELTPTPNP